jgi:hypothetical protein
MPNLYLFYGSELGEPNSDVGTDIVVLWGLYHNPSIEVHRFNGTGNLQVTQTGTYM